MAAFERAVRFWHTVRWLRSEQVWGRAWFRLYRPLTQLGPAPSTRVASGAWRACSRPSSMVGPSSFRFLGVVGDVAGNGRFEWDRLEWPRLWRYNLHYFDDLVAHGAAARLSWHRSLVEHWIAENPPGKGTGWEPYPASLRIVNWIKWALSDGAGLDGTQCQLPPTALHSLAVQSRWLRARLEIHLLGNHLWANAKALIFAGAFFDGEEAQGWLGEGLALLSRELAEQILPDGGHFERSPMYHATLLEDVLDLIQLGERYPALFDNAVLLGWRRTATAMLRWLRVMTHPDGDISFFNDAAMGIAPKLESLQIYAAALGFTRDDSPLAPIEALVDSGYVRLQIGSAVLIADVGPVGPDYLPGHAHADTLSFELSLHGQRVFVNGGTSTYAADAERLRQRGTAAHNTVLVDGKDSSEVWGSFRVARRARPHGVSWGRAARPAAAEPPSRAWAPSGSELWLKGAHDGYRRLPGSVTHVREWRLNESQLVVRDRLEGRASQAQARFRLYPRWAPVSCEAAPGGGWTGLIASGDPAPKNAPVPSAPPSIAWTAVGARQASFEESTWHPRFGATEATCVLAAELGDAGFLETTFSWQSP